MRRRLWIMLMACVSMVVAVYSAAAMWGRGGRGYFSPDTLDCRAHHEWLVPLTSISVCQGSVETYRYRTVDYLIAEGYLSPSGRAEPRWFNTFQWNEMWRDGHTIFHREFGWRGDPWIEWTKVNPEMARALWPRVLRALREPGNGDFQDAERLMRLARDSRSVRDFEELNKQ